MFVWQGKECDVFGLVAFHYLVKSSEVALCLTPMPPPSTPPTPPTHNPFSVCLASQRPTRPQIDTRRSGHTRKALGNTTTLWKHNHEQATVTGWAVKRSECQSQAMRELPEQGQFQVQECAEQKRGLPYNLGFRAPKEARPGRPPALNPPGAPSPPSLRRSAGAGGSARAAGLTFQELDQKDRTVSVLDQRENRHFEEVLPY